MANRPEDAVYVSKTLCESDWEAKRRLGFDGVVKSTEKWADATTFVQFRLECHGIQMMHFKAHFASSAT